MIHITSRCVGFGSPFGWRPVVGKRKEARDEPVPRPYPHDPRPDRGRRPDEARTPDHRRRRARMSRMAGRRDAEPLRQQLPRAGRRPAPDRRRQARRWTTTAIGMASVRFICGTQDLHRAAGDAAGAVPRAWTTAILFAACFDANGGLFEPLLGARGRGDLGRAEPCLDHRRHPAVQGAALPLRQFRHGRSRGAAEAGPRRRRAVHPDRHRRRVLDGRLLRQAAGNPRAGRPLRRAGDGGRLPRHRLHRAAGARHARARAGCRSTS